MLLEMRNVFFDYEGKVILRDLSLSINANELVIVSGPSGSGKSTLLRLLNRLAEPSRGVIVFDDKPLPEHNPVYLRRKICYLQQSPVMIEGTVRQNLLLPFTFKSSGTAVGTTDTILTDLMNKFKLDDISLENRAACLSVGQKQRLAFIRALLLEPQVLLLDEPASALDPASRSVIEEHVSEFLRDGQRAIVLITHRDYDRRYKDTRKYRLRDGALVAIAT